MNVDGYEVLEGLLYSREHEWTRVVSPKRVIAGITDYAVKLLHDVVYVTLPEVGSEVRHMQVFGSVESIKAVSDLYSPLTGKVLASNRALEKTPELVGQSPYGDGWIIEVEPTNLDAESKALLNAEGYASLIRGLGKK
ncbi:MAG: glycine cleavage system protein GcvH [Thaumarchaeota archaeon]|nr:glycine cleavage system protein GcvH [Nitrososphaerota archaeon]